MTPARTSLVFGSTGSWSPALPAPDLREWRAEYLRGFAQAARDLAAGEITTVVIGKSIRAFDAGYRAGIEAAGKKEGK